jgi:acylphosphatase
MDRLPRGWRSIHNLWFMQIARRYLISGRVQGVGFRVFAEAQAAVEGLHGWVRNLPNGGVEVLFEGDAESVDRAEAKLRRGPAGARIQDVTVEEIVPSGRATGFSIRS